jgi:4-hydroxybenzoate polyprenyltransferase
VARITGFFRLMRLANIVTAIADILAGVAIAGILFEDLNSILLLVLSTIGLYGGGVVFNDVFDAELDRVERPERPIPSGLISTTEASILGVVLLLTGIVAAFLVSDTSGIIAIAITFFALVYDKWGKHQDVLGPVNMGLCRGLNLLLGVSISSGQLERYWWLAVIPIIYISAITMISRGEVHGGNRNILYASAVFYSMVILTICVIAFHQHHPIYIIPFVVGFAYMIFPPLFKAIKDPQGKLIGKAVKAGVLALILMDAAWAAAFGVPALAFGIVLLLPLSLFLARAFAVT